MVNFITSSLKKKPNCWLSNLSIKSWNKNVLRGKMSWEFSKKTLKDTLLKKYKSKNLNLRMKRIPSFTITKWKCMTLIKSIRLIQRGLKKKFYINMLKAGQSSRKRMKSSFMKMSLSSNWSKFSVQKWKKNPPKLVN